MIGLLVIDLSQKTKQLSEKKSGFYVIFEFMCEHNLATKADIERMLQSACNMIFNFLVGKGNLLLRAPCNALW